MRCFKSKHTRLIFLLLLLSMGMFGFTFALVPLYNVFCKITGINGKLDLNDAKMGRYATARDLTEKHWITIELDANVHPNMPFEFYPSQTSIQVTPGILQQTYYHIKNKTDKTWVIQAIPSISPGSVAKYLKKLECFCFTQQRIEPKQTLQLPLRFWLEPEFPASIHRLTLSYTLFDVTQTAQGDKK